MNGLSTYTNANILWLWLHRWNIHRIKHTSNVDLALWSWSLLCDASSWKVMVLKRKEQVWNHCDLAEEESWITANKKCIMFQRGGSESSNKASIRMCRKITKKISFKKTPYLLLLLRIIPTINIPSSQQYPSDEHTWVFY